MKKKKTYDDDDGRTVADMNVEGFRWYESDDKKRKREAAKKMSKAERKALMLSSYKRIALPLICIIVGIVLAYLFCYYVWLG